MKILQFPDVQVVGSIIQDWVAQA